jgi:hypothetical protein
MHADVKTIGSSGQLSLGKEYAGRTVTVEAIEEGVWLIRTAQVIPENEMWLHTPRNRDLLNRAVAWAEKRPASESDLDAIERKLKRRR